VAPDLDKVQCSKLRDCGREDLKPAAPEQEPPQLVLPGQVAVESNSLMEVTEETAAEDSESVAKAGQEFLRDLEGLFNSLSKGQVELMRAELDRLFEEWTHRQPAARKDADTATITLLNGLAEVVRESLATHCSGDPGADLDFSLIKSSLEDAMQQQLVPWKPVSKVADITEEAEDTDGICDDRGSEQVEAHTVALAALDMVECGPWCPTDQAEIREAGENMLLNLQVLFETTSLEAVGLKAELESLFDWWQGQQDCRTEDVECMVALLEIAQSVCLDQSGKSNLRFSQLRSKIELAWRRNLPCNRNLLDAALVDDRSLLQHAVARPTRVRRHRRSTFVLSDLMDSPVNSRSAIGSSRAHRS